MDPAVVISTWSRDTLAVYADALLGDGDVRGEIIALELAQRPELEARRDALIAKWLGFDPRGWRGVRFRFGFVECIAAELERVLATPAGPYLRAVAIGGSSTDVQNAFMLLGAASRPWLARLHISSRRREPKSPFVAHPDLAAALVGALPNLDFLDITGTRVFEAFAHQTVRRVRVVGHDAIAALAEAGAPMPSVRELSYAFAQEGRIAFSPQGLPPTVLSARTLPALTSLDLSANELQRSWASGYVVLAELLAEFSVLPRLRTLRLPSLETIEERDLVQHALGLAPALADLHFTRDPSELVTSLRHAAQITVTDPPTPIHDLLEQAIYEIRIENVTYVYEASLRRLGELVIPIWHELDEDEQHDWHLLWQFLLQLPDIEWDAWTDRPFDAVRSRWFARALARLGDAVDDDPVWSALAADIRAREVTLFVRRWRGY